MLRIKLFGTGLILIGLVASCNNRSDRSKSESDIPTGAITEAYEDVPHLSKVTVNDLNGDMYLEGDLYKGEKHGAWIEYHPASKNIKLVENYFEGEKQGIELNFDENGFLLFKAFYHNNTLHGEYVTYSKRKVTEVKTYNFGVLEGPLSKFYTSGKIMEESYYMNGQMDGVATWYDQEGNVKFKYQYENGELIQELADEN